MQEGRAITRLHVSVLEDGPRVEAGSGAERARGAGMVGRGCVQSGAWRGPDKTPGVAISISAVSKLVLGFAGTSASGWTSS